MTRALVASLSLLLSSCATASVQDRSPWGVQLYTLRAAMAQDPVATIERLGALGVGEIEFAGAYGRDPATLCSAARRAGLRVAAAHVDWKQLRDAPDAALAEAKSLCADTVILAWLPPEERMTVEQWRAWITRLNAFAARAKAVGLKTAYHAHDFEFAEIYGVRPIDMLLNGLDPAIGFEMDTYWVAHAGEDPRAFLARHAPRITHLHLKDRAADGAMADVGHGVLPMRAIIAQARAQGVRHFLIERDDSPDPQASLVASLDTLAAMPFQPE